MKFLREPLVHFLLLGAILFGIFSVVGKLDVERPGQVFISNAQIEALSKAFEIDFGHQPDDAEQKKLIDDYIREEILVREAEKLQFQHDKQNIRRLMQQHMESANEGTVELPSEAQLQAFFSEHPELFRKNPGDPLPTFDQTRPAVQTAWLNAQRKLARDFAYEKIKSHYKIVIETSNPVPTTSTTPAK